jgi:FdhE protein
MAGYTVQQMLIDFNKEFAQIALPEDAVKPVRPQDWLLKSLRENDTLFIKICPPLVNTDIFFDILKEVSVIAVKHKPDLEGDINKIFSALPDDAAAREIFVRQAFTPGTNLLDSFQKEVSPETFGFILSHAVRPFMKLYARQVSAFYDPEQWHKGTCPVCGAKPTLALLEKEDKKRYLYCGLCEVRWRFQRLGCPYCLSQESRFFTVDSMEQYRVYYCDNCHGYIKTVNESMVDSGSLDLFWEDINTIHLDLLAMQEGYVNRPAEIAEIIEK